MRLELFDCAVSGYLLEHLFDSNDRLISHYETMGFERLPKYEETFVHFHIKPKYDKDCIFMSQRI